MIYYLVLTYILCGLLSYLLDNYEHCFSFLKLIKHMLIGIIFLPVMLLGLIIIGFIDIFKWIKQPVLNLIEYMEMCLNRDIKYYLGRVKF